MSAGLPDRALLSREQWTAIARAAARARQVRQDGLHGCYGDPTLLQSATAHARHELERALSAVCDVATDELLDALQAGDPTMRAGDIDELLERLRRRPQILADLSVNSASTPMTSERNLSGHVATAA